MASHFRMVMLKIEGDSLVKLASIVRKGVGILRNRVLSCCGYCGTHIVWVGLTSGIREKNRDGSLQLYDYDILTGELTELKEKRMFHKEYHPKGLHRVGDEYYYTGRKRRLMKLSINY